MMFVVMMRRVPRSERISSKLLFFFFFNDTATTEIYTLSLHDALPILFRIWFRISLLAGALALMPSLANAQSTRDVLRDFGLLGTWATDCAEPAGKSNFWAVNAGMTNGNEIGRAHV